jgi:hypothetical protein
MALRAFGLEPGAVVMALRQATVIFCLMIGAFVFKNIYRRLRIFNSLSWQRGRFLKVYE